MILTTFVCLLRMRIIDNDAEVPVMFKEKVNLISMMKLYFFVNFFNRFF